MRQRYHFGNKSNESTRRKVAGFSSERLAAFARNRWPASVGMTSRNRSEYAFIRELENKTKNHRERQALRNIPKICAHFAPKYIENYLKRSKRIEKDRKPKIPINRCRRRISPYFSDSSFGPSFLHTVGVTGSNPVSPILSQNADDSLPIVGRVGWVRF